MDLIKHLPAITILYGELKRLLDLDPDLIEKISQSGKKEGDVFHALDNVGLDLMQKLYISNVYNQREHHN